MWESRSPQAGEQSELTALNRLFTRVVNHWVTVVGTEKATIVATS
jgi:hypothetical protein